MKEYFTKLVNERQSCRNFNDKPLDKELVVAQILVMLLYHTIGPNATTQPMKVTSSPRSLRFFSRSFSSSLA